MSAAVKPGLQLAVLACNEIESICQVLVREIGRDPDLGEAQPAVLHLVRRANELQRQVVLTMLGGFDVDEVAKVVLGGATGGRALAAGSGQRR